MFEEVGSHYFCIVAFKTHDAIKTRNAVRRALDFFILKKHFYLKRSKQQQQQIALYSTSYKDDISGKLLCLF